MKRYSKKVREEAALICAIAASTPDLGASIALTGSPFGAAYELACNAWRASSSSCLRDDFERSAEAEALIRTGFRS